MECAPNYTKSNSETHRAVVGSGRTAPCSYRSRGLHMPEVTRRALLRTGLAVSAASLVSDFAIAHANALFSNSPGFAFQEASAAVAPREQFLFDFGWKFHLGSDSDALRDFD